MKIHKYGQDARDALKRGVELVAKNGKPTLGPAGKVAVLGRKGFPPRVVDDAISIAMNTESEDETEQEAVKMVQEALMRTSKFVGDSTATTLTLIDSFTDAVFEKLKDDGSLVQKKVNTIALKKELDDICDTVKKSLKEKARKITKDEMYKVAITSGTYEWIAKMVTEVFEKIGEHGYVTVEDGVNTEFEVFNGLEIKAGYNSEYYITEDGKCVMQKPYVLVVNNKIESTLPFAGLIEEISKQGVKELIVIAPDFSKDVQSRFITTTIKGGFTILPIKLFTYDKDDLYIDVATMTGAKFIDKNTYINIEQVYAEFKLTNLGTVDKVIVSNNSTMFIGGKGDTVKRVEQLQELIKKTDSVFDREELEKRIGSLSGGVANIKVGGFTDTEAGYYKLKIENAVNSVQNALREGVVKGGGVALQEISKEIGDTIITKALCAPYNQIQENNGEPFEVSKDVFDPVTNVIGAIESARSFIGNILMVETLITFKNEPKDKDENS